MTFVHPKSLQNGLKRLHNAYSTSSSHASTVLSVLHDHLCKMLIAAPPGISFFAYATSTSIINQCDQTDQTKNWQRASKIVNNFQTIMKITWVLLWSIWRSKNFCTEAFPPSIFNFFCKKLSTTTLLLGNNEAENDREQATTRKIEGLLDSLPTWERGLKIFSDWKDGGHHALPHC